MPPKRNVEQPKLSTTPVESTVSYHDDPDEDCTGLMVFTGDNFPIWEIKLKIHLRPRKLLQCIENDLPENPDDITRQKAFRTCNILVKAISDEIFNSVIDDDNAENPYAIWMKLKEIYAGDDFLSVYKAWSKWMDIPFNEDINHFIALVENSISEFNSIGLKLPDVIISCTIVAKITEKRPMLMNALSADLSASANPKLVIAKLRDLARYEATIGKKTTEEENSTAAALATSASRKRKFGVGFGCKHGKHNPDAPHSEENCWTLHPELRTARKIAKTSYLATAERAETEKEESIVKPSFPYHVTTKCKKELTTILDSGARNPMLNSIEYFEKTTPTHKYHR